MSGYLIMGHCKSIKKFINLHDQSSLSLHPCHFFLHFPFRTKWMFDEIIYPEEKIKVMNIFFSQHKSLIEKSKTSDSISSETHMFESCWVWFTNVNHLWVRFSDLLLIIKQTDCALKDKYRVDTLMFGLRWNWSNALLLWKHVNRVLKHHPVN